MRSRCAAGARRRSRGVDERAAAARPMPDRRERSAPAAIPGPGRQRAERYLRHGVGPDVLRKLRRRHWRSRPNSIVHGMTQDEACDALGVFLARMPATRGLRCVRIVHGKGLGSPGREPVLKGKVRAWLAQRDEVLAFCQAPAAAGRQRCADRAAQKRRQVRGRSRPQTRVTRLDGGLVGLAGADAHDVLDRGDEDLAVADLAGARGLHDGLDRRRRPCSSATTTSIFTLGRKSTTYSAPR